MERDDWHGVFPALTTRFHEDESLDYESMGRHLERLLEAGVHGLVILGSLGENATLDMTEKLELVDFYVRETAGRVPVLAGVAESGTREARHIVRRAQGLGAAGFMVLPPMRYTGDRRETLTYLRAVAACSELPIMLYNNPLAYGTDLLPEDFADLADEEGFLAIKESAADTRRFADIRRLTGQRYALFCGVDDLALECFALGAVGWVAGLVNAFPTETLRLYELMKEGRWDGARGLYEWFLPLLHLDVGPKFVQQIKLVEELRGMGSARVRGPRLALNATERAAVEAVYHRAMAERPGC